MSAHNFRKSKNNSKKPYPLTIAGFMSGTSLDGVDVAVIKTDGFQILEWGEHLTLPYPSEFQRRLKAILGTDVITREIVAVTKELMDYHIKAYKNLSSQSTIHMLAVHGHTIFHDPRPTLKGIPPRTWQICDPEYLQQALHKPIVYDFRSQDIMNGGEGAPLVPIFHLALTKILEETADKPVIFLNMGGVSNVTLVPSSHPYDLLAGDMGPGNALINDYVFEHFGKPYDDGGTIALSAQPDRRIVNAWLGHPYFGRPFPKSLDRDTFKNILGDVHSLPKEVSVATLSEFTVQAIVRFLPLLPKTLIVCGGGRKNQYFMKRLRSELSCSVIDSDQLHYDGDAIEAQAFAFLGARCYFGLTISFPRTTGVAFPICGGRFLPYYE